MATNRKFGIFYKIRGKWSKNPWFWDFNTPYITKGDLPDAIDDAKFYLKSKLSVKELVGNTWRSVKV